MSASRKVAILSHLKIRKEEMAGFVKKGNPRKKNISIKPYLEFKDLNNALPGDILSCNPKKSAVVIGVKFSF